MGDFNRLNDRFVKFLFANPKHKNLLIAFLNEVLADIPAGAEPILPIVDIEYADRETSPEHEREKMPRFDVIARTMDGRLFHIEIQLVGYDNLLPRTLIGGEEEMQVLATKDERVAEMRQLEKIFRSNPDLVREYQQREQDELDYRLSLEAREKRGEARGAIKGKIEGFSALIRKGLLSLKDAASELNMTEAEFNTQRAALGF